MIKLLLRVTLDTGEVVDVSATPSVIVAFERHFKVGLAGALSADQKMEHVYWLAWKGMHASGRVVKPFDQWLDTIENVELEVGEARPLAETP